MKPRTRMQPEARRENVLNAAMKEAEKVGFNKVQRSAIAKRADCSVSLVTHYFGTVQQLQRVIMREAIRTDNDKIIAQGVVAKHPQCRKLTPERKFQALEAIA